PQPLAGGAVIYAHNTGMEPQFRWFYQKSAQAEPSLLLDPNALSEDGTVAIAGFGFDHAGRYLAYGLSQAGSDWRTFHVRDLTTGEDLADEVKWMKSGAVAWREDGSGFY